MKKSPFDIGISLSLGLFVLAFLLSFLQPESEMIAGGLIALMVLGAFYPARHIGHSVAHRIKCNVTISQWGTFIVIALVIIAFGMRRVWPKLVAISPVDLNFNADENSALRFYFANNTNDNLYSTTIRLTVLDDPDAKFEDFAFKVDRASVIPAQAQGHTIDTLMGHACRDAQARLVFVFYEPQLAPHQSKQMNIIHLPGRSIHIQAANVFATKEAHSVARTGDVLSLDVPGEYHQRGCKDISFKDPFYDE